MVPAKRVPESRPGPCEGNSCISACDMLPRLQCRLYLALLLRQLGTQTVRCLLDSYFKVTLSCEAVARS